MSENYKKHSQNLAAVQKSLTQFERVHKQLIRERGSDTTIDAIARFHRLHVAVLAEASLRKIVTDPGGFSVQDQTDIWAERSQSDRWIKTVELAFLRHRKLVLGPVQPQLNTQDSDRFEALRTLLSGELANTITDRNRTAHAQWVWHLKSGKDNAFKTGIVADQLKYLQIVQQAQLVQSLARLINILVVSDRTFSRDFEKIMATIHSLQRVISDAEMTEFANSLRRGAGKTRK